MNLFGLTANLIDAFMLICGKGGKLLNARGIRYCFLVDMFCLSYWFYMDINRGLISQAIGCLVSFGISIYAFQHWGKHPPIRKVVEDD